MSPPAENAVVLDEPEQEAKPGDGSARKPAAGEPPKTPTLSRKIIYNADLRIVVDNIERAGDALKQIVKENNAYIANSNLTGAGLGQRQGTWTIRVPVDQFQPCVDALLKLGIPQQNKTDSKDVTEEYYDIEARIKNKQVEETRLQGYLEEKKSTSKLEDILTIERELNRVRGEIDQLQGRLRLLGSLSAQSTITLTLLEVKDYVSPQAPDFGGQIASTFSGSVNLLTEFGKGVTLVAVALAPWLGVLAVLALLLLPFWLLARWRRRAARRAEPVPVVAVEAEPAPAGG
jgi:hypothetical protein